MPSLVGKANKPHVKDSISLHGQSEATLLQQMHQFGWMVTVDGVHPMKSKMGSRQVGAFCDCVGTSNEMYFE